jgi:two-component system nitrate/nitrite response regulator NarL
MIDSQLPIRVLVVDDHTLFRRGLIALLSQDNRFLVGCEAADMGEALRCVAKQLPDIILLDNHMPGVRGIDGIPSLKEAAPTARILMLTVSENEEDLVNALRAGADGYLLKTTESGHLTDSIVKVLTGESVVSPEMTSKLVAALRNLPQSVPPPPAATTAAPTRHSCSTTCPPANGKSCARLRRASATRSSGATWTLRRPPSRTMSSTSCAN